MVNASDMLEDPNKKVSVLEPEETGHEVSNWLGKNDHKHGRSTNSNPKAWSQTTAKLTAFFQDESALIGRLRPQLAEMPKIPETLRAPLGLSYASNTEGSEGSW